MANSKWYTVVLVYPPACTDGKYEDFWAYTWAQDTLEAVRLAKRRMAYRVRDYWDDPDFTAEERKKARLVWQLDVEVQYVWLGRVRVRAAGIPSDPEEDALRLEHTKGPH